jgi:nucleotide-binding universal stress UspA family protein
MIREIALYVDDRPLSARLAELAAVLARRFDARLVGVHVGSLLTLPLFLDTGPSAELLEALEAEMLARAGRARAQFDAVLARSGVAGEWRLDRTSLAGEALVHARHADLVMIGQHDPEREASTFARVSPADLVLAAGRPVLVVPHAGRFADAGQRVIVAWNGSREATRAVHDAMPILRAAREVAVLTIENSAGDADPGRWPGADIAAHLARHGVNVATRHAIGGEVSVADALLNLVADDGADLIVMGAYGTSRAREFVLGGATRDLLRTMTVPVLMSH